MFPPPVIPQTSPSTSARIAASSRRVYDQEHHNTRLGVLLLDGGLFLFDWKTILAPI